MKNLILVHSFSEKDFSLSKFNNFFYAASEKAEITDVVLFLPCEIRASEDFLMGLANYASYCSPNTHFDFFIDESDYEDLPFEFFEYLCRMNPNFHLHSKEDGVYIGEHYFKWFDLNKEFDLDEVKFYPKDVVRGEKRNYVVPSKKEQEFIGRLSNKFNCIASGETQVLLRRRSRDFMYRKSSIEEDKLSNSFSYDYLFTDNNDLKIDKKGELL